MRIAGFGKLATELSSSVSVCPNTVRTIAVRLGTACLLGPKQAQCFLFALWEIQHAMLFVNAFQDSMGMRVPGRMLNSHSNNH